MHNNFNGDWENKMLSLVPKEIERVKSILAPELEEYKKANSVISSSVDFIENSVNSPIPLQDKDMSFEQGSSNGVEQTKANVRIRTMEGPHGFVSESVKKDNNVSQSYYSGYSESFNQTTSKTGSVTTLILAGTAVLVMLVVFVSLFVMNFVGF